MFPTKMGHEMIQEKGDFKRKKKKHPSVASKETQVYTGEAVISSGLCTPDFN